MPSYPKLVRGTAAWLYSVVSGQLATINTELAAGVKAVGSVPVFTVSLGDLLEPGNPVISICYYGTSRNRFAQHNYEFSQNFILLALIPRMGDDASEDYEMARQVAADNLLSLFTDESTSLTPAINAGPLGPVKALSTEIGDLVDIGPRKMADGKSYVWGFELPISVSFVLKSSS